MFDVRILFALWHSDDPCPEGDVVLPPCAVCWFVSQHCKSVLDVGVSWIVSGNSSDGVLTVLTH